MTKSKLHKVIAQLDNPVMAAFDPTNIKKVMVSAHVCPSCNTNAVLSKLAVNPCPVCATPMDPVDDNLDLEITPEELKGMNYLADCSSCNTYFATTAAAHKALVGHKLHCTVCASEMDVQPYAEDEDSFEEDADENTLVSEEDDASYDEEEMEDGDEYSSDDEEEMLDEPVMEDEDYSEEEMEDEVTARVKLKVKASTDDESSSEDDMSDEDEEMFDESSEETPSLSVNMLTHAINNRRKLSFDLVLSGSADDPIWYIFADKRPVATATLSKASAGVKPIFATQRFRDSFAAIIAEDEINEEAINDLGIEPIKTDIPVDEATQQQVSESVEVATAEYSLTKEEIKARIERCIGIAAVGINKNVFEDVGNPLRDGIVSKLSALAVRKPEIVADEIIANFGEEFLRAVIKKGMELTSKSNIALDEIANMVKSIKPSYHHQTEIKAHVEDVTSPRLPFMATNQDNLIVAGNNPNEDKRRRAVSSLSHKHTRI